jgi:hypothetical protein
VVFICRKPLRKFIKTTQALWNHSEWHMNKISKPFLEEKNHRRNNSYFQRGYTPAETKENSAVLQAAFDQEIMSIGL